MSSEWEAIGYKVGGQAFIGTVQGRRLTGTYFGRFDLGVQQRCPGIGKLPQECKIELSLSREGKVAEGRFEGRTIDSDCRVSKGEWQQVKLERLGADSSFQDDPVWDALKDLLETIFDNLPNFEGKEKIGTAKDLWNAVQDLRKKLKFTLADAVKTLEKLIAVLNKFAEKGANTDATDLSQPLLLLVEDMEQNGMMSLGGFKNQVLPELMFKVAEWGQKRYAKEEDKKELQEKLKELNQKLAAIKKKLPLQK